MSLTDDAGTTHQHLEQQGMLSVQAHVHSIVLSVVVGSGRDEAACAQVLEACRRHMAQGQAATIVADLTPVLLDEACPHAGALRRERRTFLDALRMLRVHD